MKGDACTVRARQLIALLILSSACAQGVVADENLINEYTHLGVASCVYSLVKSLFSAGEDPGL